ncbi:MAG: hypothetical protein BWY76_00653 [bacterium ADurb.Bin429]|nr:MAG: hypothetical protein BWY76_00653 [bacterium ADurb.Bin429]
MYRCIDQHARLRGERQRGGGRHPGGYHACRVTAIRECRRGQCKHQLLLRVERHGGSRRHPHAIDHRVTTLHREGDGPVLHFQGIHRLAGGIGDFNRPAGLDGTGHRELVGIGEKARIGHRDFVCYRQCRRSLGARCLRRVSVKDIPAQPGRVTGFAYQQVRLESRPFAGEDVTAAVRVAGHQIRRQRVEGDNVPLAIQGHAVLCRIRVPLHAVAGEAGAVVARPVGVIHIGVALAIGIAADQVRRVGAIGHEAPVAIQRRPGAGAVATRAHAGGDAGQPAHPHHIPGAVRVAAGQIRRHGDVGDEGAVAANRRIVAVAVALRRAQLAHSRGRAQRAIVQEHVTQVVRVARHQVAGIRAVDDIAAIRAHRRVLTAVIRRRAVQAGGNEQRLPVRHVAQEDIRHVVRVARHQVRGFRLEDHVLPAGAHPDAIGAGVAGSLGSRAFHAHPDRRPRLPVMEEDILLTVRIAGYQVRRRRAEGHVTAIRTDCRHVTRAVRLRAA